MSFELISTYQPAGDQPEAIRVLTQGLSHNEKNQVLLGVTGSGKTFTMAHVIQNVNRPSLILAHNKTLAAQLYGEMKSFFPNNAVEYFVSYYDYYQPEAYIPKSGVYIEKEATVNEQIDRMRHSATRALLERRDVIIVASVSCIYGIGGIETYSAMTISLKKGKSYDMQTLLEQCVALQYKRNDISFVRGTFRVRGDSMEIFPAHLEDRAWRFSFFGNELESIHEIDALTGKKMTALDQVIIYPNSHYVTPMPTIHQAVKKIQKDLDLRIQEFESMGKLVEAQRIRERVTFDVEMMITTGTCPGIENYSRYLTGRNPGEPPPTLFDYLPQDALLFVDESHITVPQLHAMYRGDAARKHNLSEYGFRLPACRDNRPLKFEEWDQTRPNTIFVSATPGPFELQLTHGVFAEQVIRPTGLKDPVCEIYPTKNQVDHLIEACRDTIQKGYRTLVTTLTKKMAEALTEYLHEAGFKVRYVHSDVETLERIQIIRDLRLGTFDVLVGINLLREGLDIPECALVAILDADKEGYLRSKTALIQTIGRAARNVDGKAILYADKITGAMKEALDETERRRHKQSLYNEAHGITPTSIQKNIHDILESVYEKDHMTVGIEEESLSMTQKEKEKMIRRLEKEMLNAASKLEFEEAARLRDTLKKISSLL